MGRVHLTVGDGAANSLPTDRRVDALKRGALEVYKGEYTGVSPNDPEDTVDLRQGYEENEKGSWATFHYVLDDVITIEE